MNVSQGTQWAGAEPGRAVGGVMRWVGGAAGGDMTLVGRCGGSEESGQHTDVCRVLRIPG